MRRVFGVLRKMMPRIPHSVYNIRTELFFSYFLIIFLLIALVGTVSYYYASRSAIELAEQGNIQIAKQIQKSLDRDFQHKADLLIAPYFDSSYINGISRYSYMNESEQYLFRQRIGNLYLMRFYVLPQPDFVRFSIYHSSGELLVHSDSFRRPRSYADSDMLWFIETVKNKGKVYFSGSYKDPDPAHDRMLYSSSIMIRDYSLPDDYFVVRAEYNVKLLEELSNNANISKYSDIVIFDERGGTIFSTLNGQSGIWYRELASKARAQEGPFWMEQNKGERLHITAMQSERSDWNIVLITPESDIFAASESIKMFTIVIVCIAFAVTSLLSLLFSRRIVQPIQHMHQTLANIKKGDLSARVKIDRKNELGRIAENFNILADELQQFIQHRYIHELKLREAKLALLYSQINPHFLYNTLESIRAMAELHEVKKVSQMTSALGDLFRYNIKETGEFVTVKDEIDQIEQYLTIQTIRFGDKVRPVIHVDESLWSANMLKMTLQPLVENAVYHGLERKKGAGRVTIKITQTHSNVHDQEKSIMLEVSDDGVGIPSDVQRDLIASLNRGETMSDIVLKGRAGNGEGIGLSNVMTRYMIRYGHQFQYDIESTWGEGTTIRLRFPLEYEEERSEI